MVHPDDLDLAAQRVDYTGDGLSEADLAADPAAQFRAWYQLAEATDMEANAMVLSTVGSEGPSSRIVLLKGFDDRGFWFYTNRESRKARDIAHDDRVALVFPWHPLQRQVRVIGRAVSAPDEASDAYFASRDRDSQLSAWASAQSRETSGRAAMEERLAEVRERFGDGAIPRPDFWGGYVVEPREIEFWAGRRSRFHDRMVWSSRSGAPADPGDASAWELARRQP